LLQADDKMLRLGRRRRRRKRKVSTLKLVAFNVSSMVDC
jgi:hypothetical protein